jgi:type II secretory pathway pseudopilin PulG
MYVFWKTSPFLQKSKNGYSLVEVLAGVAITSVLFLGVSASVVQFSKQQQHLSARLTAMTTTMNLRRTIANDSALMNTLFNPKNSAFDCMRDGTLEPLTGSDSNLSGCAGKSGTLNHLISSSGQELSDLSDPTAGFTVAGEPCTGFGKDPLCAVRAHIDVKFVCDSASAATCLKPQIVLTGSIEMMDESGSLVKLDNVFEVHKDWSTVSTNLVELSHSEQTSSSTGMALKSFKLVIIVDNSTSMSAYQKKLVDGLGPMLDSLRTNDFDLAVQILSTSQFLMNAPNPYVYTRPINSAQQILDLTSVGCSDGVKSRSGYCGNYPQMSGMQKEIYQLKQPVQVILPANAVDTNFQTFKSTILSTIQNMGVSGSDDEQGLCTLSRLLTGGNTFISAGSKVGVILISNEQDHSSSRTCATEISRKYLPLGKRDWTAEPFCGTGDSTPAPITDHVEYRVKAQSGSAGYRIDFRCNAYRDGEFVPYSSTDPSTFRSDTLTPNYTIDSAFPREAALKIYGVDIDKTCQQSGISFTGSYSLKNLGDTVKMQTGQCSPEILAALEKNTSCGNRINGTLIPGKVAKCEVSCNDSLNYAPIEIRAPTNLSASVIRQVDNLSVNYCSSSFALGDSVKDLIEEKYPDSYLKMVEGSTYANISAYLPFSPTSKYGLWAPPSPTQSNCCRIQEYHQPYPAPDDQNIYTSVFEPVGLANLPLEDALIQRADTLLGKDGYFISSIIHTSDPAKACPMAGSETTGLAFESLASKVQKSSVIPICAADYSPALAPLRQFIQTSVSTILANNSIIKLKQGEQLVQLYVSNGTQQFQFTIGGTAGVWPTLISTSSDGLEKTYQLDFSKTAYSLQATDRVWGLVAKQTSEFSVDTIGGVPLSYDDLRSLYRIGLGH